MSEIKGFNENEKKAFNERMKQLKKEQRKTGIIFWVGALILVIVVDSIGFCRWTENALTVFVGLGVVVFIQSYLKNDAGT